MAAITLREGERVPDGKDYPGRNKVIWRLGGGFHIRWEAHPHFGPNAGPEETNPHWQVHVPGNKKDAKYFPGDPIPGCK